LQQRYNCDYIFATFRFLFGWKLISAQKCRPILFSTRTNLHAILPSKIIRPAYSLFFFILSHN